jgi:hypothetical protein
MMIGTPDKDEDDEQRIDDSADDSDYDDAPVANPTPKSLPRKIRNKKSGPKLTAYQLLALMSAKFLRSFFGDWYLQ